MKSYRNPLGILSVIVALGLAAPAAAEVTPSHVYQVVDAIHAELAEIHKVNGTKPASDPGAGQATARQPRHVIQKAREVLFKVELLRDMHNLPASEVPPFPTREVKPEDVKGFVDAVLSQLQDVKKKVGVKKPTAKAALPSGKKPTDVYAHLQQANLSLDGMGIRETRPFDVYRVALTIIHEVELIRGKLGINGKIETKRHAGKRPQDVYKLTYQLLTDVRAMTEKNAKLKVPGSVVLPNKRAGEIKPKDVMGLMNNLLAEIGAIKIKLGITEATQFALPKSGSTPSNGYDAVYMAEQLIKSFGSS